MAVDDERISSIEDSPRSDEFPSPADRRELSCPPSSSSSSSSDDYEQTLLRSAVYRMRVADLRHELAHRGMDTSGTKVVLVPRLLSVLPQSIARRSREKGGKRVIPSSSDSYVEPISSVVASLDHPSPDSTERRGDASDPAVHADRFYVLQVKGLSSLKSDGTGVGIVLFDPSDESARWEARHCLRHSRNAFEAEYSAMAVAIRFAARLGVTRVVLETDQEVIHKQITGSYEVKRPTLRSLHWTLMGLKNDLLQEFVVHPISLSEIGRAHKLAHVALVTGKSINFYDTFDPMSTPPNDFDVAAPKDSVPFGHPPLRNGESPATAPVTIIDPQATYRLQFDGGARKNPTGIAGAGVVIYDATGTELWCGWKFLDRMTNNCAEYCALLLGLRCARSLGIRSLDVEGDSELIIKQLTFGYRVKDENMKRLWEAARAEVNEYDQIQLRHIPRNLNRRADFLANCAMDEKSSHGFAEVNDAPSSQTGVR
jgi:ribonuclease HI